jgi:DNA polymerase III subunit chi
MTRVSFYSNVDNKHALISHLVQNALKQKRQVTLFVADALAAQQFSDVLWSQSAESFLPNVLANDSLATQTPIVIDWLAETIFQDDILINLQHNQPIFFSRFKHLIEMVSLDEHEKTAARKRYAFYRDCGYEIKHVDMLKKSI